jgi:hypothetical protein
LLGERYSPSGYELAEIVREKLPDVKVIGIAGSEQVYVDEYVGGNSKLIARKISSI